MNATFFAVLVTVLAGASIAAAPAPASENTPLRQLELVRDKSVLLDTPEPLKRTSITNPEIANLVVVSPQQLLVNGNRTGTTNLIVWLASGQTAVYNITVSADTDLIKRRLDELLPRNTIRVSGAGDLIILSGEVDDIAQIEQAQAIAESLAASSAALKPQGGAAPPTATAPATAILPAGSGGEASQRPPNVVNLIKVASLQQVMVEVTVAEVDREVVRELGLNVLYNGYDVNGMYNVGHVATPNGNVPSAGGTPANFSLSDVLGVMVGVPRYNVTGFLHALKGNGLAKILAEPSLITVSGERASFLAGGEFPIPVQQNTNAVTVIFREFGVRLNFTPTVLGAEKISMKVAPEVSELDFTTAVTVGTLVVPGLRSRKADTTVELSTGESFAIAGLINSELTSQVDKFPVLGEVPILGALFRSTKFRNKETELLIVVTPRLVRPIAAGKRPELPGDGMRPPTDFESFLMGRAYGHTDVKPVGPWGFEK